MLGENQMSSAAGKLTTPSKPAGDGNNTAVASRITALASVIAKNSAKLDESLKSHGLKSPSFDPSSLDHKWPPSAESQMARIAIFEAASELQALILEPTKLIQDLVLKSLDLISLSAIYKFGIAQSFSESATYEQISQKCGLDESTVRRILRHAITYYVFKEQDGVVMHTAASQLLHDNQLMRAWVGLMCEEGWPAASRTGDALQQWPGSQEPEHSGFNIAHNTTHSFFDELGKDSARAKRYADAISSSDAGHGTAISALVNHYPWEAVGSGTVVDVGGSHGDRSVAIAKKFQSINCVVLDLPDHVADGQSKIPSDLKNRVTFAAHDFFTDPPEVAKGADVYLFSRVFHNWSDKYAIKILQCLRPALKEGARILAYDICLKEPNVLPRTLDNKMRASDMGMLAISNAKERGRDDWTELFRKADERYHFMDARTPPGSQLSFIEANWEGNGEI